MIKKLSIIFSVVMMSASASWAQVELGGDDEPVKEEKKGEDKGKRDKDGSTEAYLMTNWSNTSRQLQSSAPPFGDTLGQRAFENSLNRWSFGIGFRSQLNHHISIQGGISYLRNGESYLFEESDTLFQYNTTYTYIGMPIKALYTYGEDVKILAGAGLTPQLFISYVQEQEWRDSVNATGDEKIKEQNGYSSFVLSAAFNIGIQLKLSESFSFLFMPEYRIQLTDSYIDTDSFDHFGRAVGFDIGLTYKL